MMKKINRLLLGLVLCVLSLSAWSQTLQDPDVSIITKTASQPPKASVVRELPSRNTPNSRHYLLDNGKIEARIGHQPFQYRDANGAWRSIDTRLIPSVTDGAFLRNEQNLFSLSLPVFSDQSVRLGLEYGDLVWTPLGHGFGQDLSPWPRLRGARDGEGAARFGNRQDFLSERYEVLPGALKHDLILSRSPGEGQGDYIFWGSLTLPEGVFLEKPVIASEMTGDARPLRLVDAAGNTLMILDPPFAYEEDGAFDSITGQRASKKSGRWIIEEGEIPGVWQLGLAIEGDWLNDPARLFPVVVDPTFSTVGGWGGWQNSAPNNKEANPETFVFASSNYISDEYRAFIQWDTSSLADSVYVESVEVNLYCNLKVGTNNPVAIWNVNNQAPFGGYNATVYGDLAGGSLYTSVDILGVGATGYLDLGTRAVSDAQTRLADGFFSIGLTYTGAAADDFVRFNSADASGNSMLRVVYDYAPMGSVIISEVNRGGGDSIELYNYGPDITLTGAVMTTYDNSLDNFVFPTFTLRKHNFVVIHEGSGTDTATDLYATFGWGWTTNVGGEVGLMLNSEPLDYVFFGNVAVQTTIADDHIWSGGAVLGAVNYVARLHDGDTHSVFDWGSNGSSIGSRNPGQVGSRRRSPVVINEAYLGNPDAVELANVSPVDVDLSGWQLRVWTNNSLNGTLTIPSGTTIEAGGYLVIHESGGLDGDGIIYSGFNFGWGTAGEIALFQADGMATDYVAFGVNHSTNVPPGVGWTGAVANSSSAAVWRNSDLDTDSSSDWTSGSTTNLTLGRGNANQLGRFANYDEIAWDNHLANLNTSPRARGNFYDVTQATTVLEWKQALDLPSSQTVNFVIQEESSPGSGVFNVISNITKTYGPGFDTYSSGPISVVLTPGKRYSFMPYWSVGSIYYRDTTGITNHPEYVSFGTFAGFAYNNLPIDTSVSNSGTGTALHQYISSVPGSALPLIMLTNSVPDAFNGDAYGHSFLAQGGYGSYTWTRISGTLPPGLTLSSGYLSGTIGGGGTYSFTIRLTDSLGQTVDRAFSIHVQSSGFVTILSTSVPNGVVNAEYPAVQLQAKSVTGSYTWNMSAGALPTGLTLNGNGTITGTPTVLGDFNFTARVVDGNARVATKALTLSVVRPSSENVWVRRGLFGAELSQVVASPNYTEDATMFTAGLGQNLYKSTDGGATWVALPVTNMGVITSWTDLVTSPRYDNNAPNGFKKTLVAIIRADGISKVMRSTNGGTSWNQYSPSGNPGVWAVRLSPNYENDGVAVLRGTDILYRSLNYAQSWNSITATGVQDVQFSPDFSSDQQVYRLDSDGDFRRSTGWGSWSLLSTTLNLSGSSFQLSPNFTQDRTVFAGGNAAFAPGAYRSTDGGYSWEALLSSEDGLYGSLIPLPLHKTFDFQDSNTDTVFFQDWTSGGFEARVYRSDDGGDTFQPFSSMPPSEYDDDPGNVNMRGAYILSPDWENDNTMFHARTGFWLSRDDGLSWELRTRGINGLRVREVHVSPNYASDGTVFIVAKAGGLFKSTNFGATFTLISIPMDGDPTRNDPGVYAAGISTTYDDLGSNGHARTIYAGSNWGFYKSVNGGTTWGAIGTNPMNPGEFGDPIEFIDLPNNYHITPYVLVGSVATGHGFYRYLDTTQTWTLLRGAFATPDTLFGGFSPNFWSDGLVIMSYRDFNNDPLTYKTNNFTASTPTYTEITDGGAQMGGRVVFSPNYYNLTSQAGQPVNTFWVGREKTTNRGSTFTNQVVEPLALSSNFASDTIVFAAGNGSVSDGLYRSTTGGTSYSEIGGSAFTNVVIDSLGVFPGYNTSTGQLMAGTVGAGVSLSTDGGTTFTPTEGTASISEDVRGVDVDPVDPAIVYAATGDGGVFKSTDKGLTFHHLTDGLPTVNQEFNDIRVVNANRILAGHAVDGVYMSNDAGASWFNLASTTGSVVTFSSGGSTLWGAREDGRSIKSTDNGSTWTEMDPAVVDMVDFSYGGDVPVINSLQGSSPTNQSFKPGNPSLTVQADGLPEVPFGLQSPTWGVSKTTGPVGSEDGGTTFVSSTGAGGPFPLPTGVDYLSVVVLAADNLQVLTGIDGGGMWKTWDGGDTWHRMTRGLESSSQVVAELYETSNGDLLAGITGTTDGGVYLSADGGVHWAVINEGFDPDELSVQDLVNDPGDGSEISYWAGKDADGIWTRTIEVLPNPTVSNITLTSGTALGGSAFTVTGSNFQDGAVVEFDGIPGVTTFVSDTTLTVITPAHFVGVAVVTVVNPDTRTGLAGQNFTFTEPGILVDLTVTTNGTDVTLSWTDGNGKGAWNVFWSNDPTFSNEWVELASENDPGPTWVHSSAATTNFVYFYKVE